MGLLELAHSGFNELGQIAYRNKNVSCNVIIVDVAIQLILNRPNDTHYRQGVELREVPKTSVSAVS